MDYPKSTLKNRIVVTPALIAAEKKPTRKAALIMIYADAHTAPDSAAYVKAWDMIQDLVPYYAIEFFFDRVQAMSRVYTA